MGLLAFVMVVSGALMIGYGLGETWAQRLFIAGLFCIGSGVIELLK